MADHSKVLHSFSALLSLIKLFGVNLLTLFVSWAILFMKTVVSQCSQMN